MYLYISFRNSTQRQEKEIHETLNEKKIHHGLIREFQINPVKTEPFPSKDIR